MHLQWGVKEHTEAMADNRYQITDKNKKMTDDRLQTTESDKKILSSVISHL